MFSRRSDLPLDRDDHSRLLRWLNAFMVFQAVLAMTAVLVLNATAGRWDHGVRGTLTVQIARVDADDDNTKRLQQTLNVLAVTPEIDRYEVIDDAQLLRLLEPWLGHYVEVGDLPLPQLIDVALKAKTDLNLRALSNRIAAQVPGTSIDDHEIWLERLVRLIEMIEGVAAAVLIFVGLATVGTVVFTTRTGLAIHKEAIEVLHLIGAQDSYIARQFAGRAMALGLRGGIMGLALAIPTVLGVGYLAQPIEGALVPQLGLEPAHWGILAMLPVAAAVIAMLTARLTVMRTLGRIL
ncbi:MAG: cell division protein [Rhodospirillales bacterium]